MVFFQLSTYFQLYRTRFFKFQVWNGTNFTIAVSYNKQHFKSSWKNSLYSHNTSFAKHSDSNTRVVVRGLCIIRMQIVQRYDLFYVKRNRFGCLVQKPFSYAIFHKYLFFLSHFFWETMVWQSIVKGLIWNSFHMTTQHVLDNL